MFFNLQHIALTVNEELDLHARLLDELDEDVEVNCSLVLGFIPLSSHVLGSSQPYSRIRARLLHAQGTHSRMRAAQKRLKGVLRRSGNCRSMCLTIGLMAALAVLIVVAFKLAALF